MFLGSSPFISLSSHSTRPAGLVPWTKRAERERDEWEETREWGELMPRERSKGNIIQPLGRECSCRSASPFSLLSSSLPVSSPPYHPARTGPFGPRRVSGEKWGRSTSQRKERYGHWAASVSPKFRSFRSSIAPLPRQSSPLPFTTFMSLRLSDGSVAYGTDNYRSVGGYISIASNNLKPDRSYYLWY